MITWKRLNPGEYISTDSRFYIIQSYDRIYGDYWKLVDTSVSDVYKGTYHEKTLLACKLNAEYLGRVNSNDQK